MAIKQANLELPVSSRCPENTALAEKEPGGLRPGPSKSSLQIVPLMPGQGQGAGSRKARWPEAPQPGEGIPLDSFRTCHAHHLLELWPVPGRRVGSNRAPVPASRAVGQASHLKGLERKEETEK